MLFEDGPLRRVSSITIGLSVLFCFDCFLGWPLTGLKSLIPKNLIFFWSEFIQTLERKWRQFNWCIFFFIRHYNIPEFAPDRTKQYSMRLTWLLSSCVTSAIDIWNDIYKKKTFLAALFNCMGGIYLHKLEKQRYKYFTRCVIWI